MEQRIFKEVVLVAIQPNPENPRKNYSGPKFEEFVASVRKVGVIEPILIRPKMVEHTNILYEIVAGERRWRARNIVASENGGPDHATIPAIIQEMTDDEAFDLMTIENLQREDLTELEEAQSFKIYLDKKGKDALPELAERTGIKQSYIARRMAVLTLPDKVLTAWDAGKIKYGHCEQLVRVKDKNAILEYLEQIIDDPDEMMSVRDLKWEIEHRSVSILGALFDLSGAGCLQCPCNSDVQSDLFNEVMQETHCTNQKCFQQNQYNWLTANWKTHRGKAGTNGFRFYNDVNHNDRRSFDAADKPGIKCKECQFYVSLVSLEGQINAAYRRTCIGDKSCFNSIVKAGKIEKTKLSSGDDRAVGKSKTATDVPRVAWHGEFFREEFYMKRIPDAISAIPATDLRCLQLSLMAIIKCNSSSRVEFANQWVCGKKKIQYAYDVDINDIWKKIISMTADEITQAHRDLAKNIIMQKATVTASERHYAAVLVGIDLAKEWILNKEYLEKKTTNEMLDLIDRLGISKDEKALAYLHESLNKKRGRFDTCKKAELIDLVLKSGVDLAGKVPKEILTVGRD